jgi:ubiquinone/menaquinone biosynthesis C-methylase UbiE
MSSFTQSARYQRCQAIFDRAYPTFKDAGTHYTEHIAAQVTPKSLLLDVGCGRDSLAAQPIQRAHYTTGIDLALEDLQQNQLLHSTSMANATHLPFPDVTFDVVVSQWVVEHFTAPEHAFAEISRVLKPGGAFILMTTNAHNYIPLISRMIPSQLQEFLITTLLKRPRGESFPTYFRANTHQRLTMLAAASGLEIEHFVFVGNPFYMVFNVLAFRAAVVFEKLTDAPRWQWLKLYIVATLRKPATPHIPLRGQL